MRARERVPERLLAHGVCKRRKCECAPGYTGRSCGTQPLPPPDGRLRRRRAERACPNRCWGRGACVADPATGAGKCACDPGYVGSDCSQVEACPDDCGGRGLCQYGACFCDPGWEGANCSSAAGCPHGCSAHGECRHGLCYCEPGYDGAGCEIAPPPSTRAEIAPHALAALCAMVFVAATLGGLALKVVSDQRRRARDPVHPGERRAGALRERRAQARGRRAVRGGRDIREGGARQQGSETCGKNGSSRVGLHSSAFTAHTPR